MQVHVQLKNAFPGGIGNRRIRFGYNLWFASHPSSGKYFEKCLEISRDFSRFLALLQYYNLDSETLKFSNIVRENPAISRSEIDSATGINDLIPTKFGVLIQPQVAATYGLV